MKVQVINVKYVKTKNIKHLQLFAISDYFNPNDIVCL